ncbi:AraC family transcriptional regulator [Spirosoma agri]|nr:AraC family transcriptional regulator [Spirosoma agri]
MLKLKGVDLLLRREALAGPAGVENPFQEKLARIQHEQMGCITDTQISTGNFFIAHCTFQLTQSVQLSKEVEEEVIQLDFALRGESQGLTTETTSRQRFSTGQHNICYIPRSKSTYDYYASDQPLDYCIVVIPKETYIRLLASSSGLHRQLDTLMAQQKTGYASAKNLPITPLMDWLIRDMRTSPRTGSLKRLFLESRVTELLMLQLEQMQGTQPIGFPSKTADIRKLHEACEILDASYADPPTIVELAKLVCLNEFNLKRGFKEQTGTTILGYVTRRRMEDAKRLLLAGDKTISEIAYWVGYKNPAHFTVAFKQYFGVLPSTIRR